MKQTVQPLVKHSALSSAGIRSSRAARRQRPSPRLLVRALAACSMLSFWTGAA